MRRCILTCIHNCERQPLLNVYILFSIQPCYILYLCSSIWAGHARGRHSARYGCTMLFEMRCLSQQIRNTKRHILWRCDDATTYVRSMRRSDVLIRSPPEGIVSMSIRISINASKRAFNSESNEYTHSSTRIHVSARGMFGRARTHAASYNPATGRPQRLR